MNQTKYLLLATSIPIGIFVLLVLFLGVNIPQQDDFDSIFYYLLNSGSSLTTGLAEIHVSHRLVLTRLLARLSLITDGAIDLRLLMLAGVASLLGSIVLFYRSLSESLPRNYLLLVFCLITLSLFHWSNMLWATASIQNYTGLFAGLLTLYLFKQNRIVAITASVILAACAPYISSNGLLLLPLLLIWTLCSKPGDNKQSKPLISLLTILSVVSPLVYFLGFEDRLELSETLTAVLGPGLLVRTLGNFLIASAGFLHFPAIALIGGSLMMLFVAFLMFHRYDRTNSFQFYSIAYLILSIGLISVFRGNDGVDQLIASRYQIFTCTLAALLIASFIELGLDRSIAVKYCRQLILGLCALFYLASFYYVGNLLSERDKIVSGVLSWQDSGTSSGLYHPQPDRAALYLNNAIQTGIYEIPSVSSNSGIRPRSESVSQIND